MFRSAKHLTKGVQSSIGLDLQILMWSMIDQWRDKIELDYLQVFELSIVEENGILFQKIIHSQEESEYREENFYKIADPVNGEVWIMDSGEYCTMLLPEEN